MKPHSYIGKKEKLMKKLSHGYQKLVLLHKKTRFLSIMTYFAKGDHLQLIKVLKSHKLTDYR